MKIGEYIELVKQAETVNEATLTTTPVGQNTELPGTSTEEYTLQKPSFFKTIEDTAKTLGEAYLPESTRDRLSSTYNRIKDNVSNRYKVLKDGRVGKVAKGINRFGDGLMKRLNPAVVPIFALADTIPSRMRLLQKSIDEGNPMTFGEGMEHYVKGVGSLAPQISLPMRFNPAFLAQMGMDMIADNIGMEPDQYPGLYNPSAESRLTTKREIPTTNYDHVNPYEYSFNRENHYIPNYIADLYGGIFDFPYQLLQAAPSVNINFPTRRRKFDVWRSPEDEQNMLNEGWKGNYLDYVNAKTGKTEEGKEVIDYPAMFGIIGGKSWDEINPERSSQELRNVPEYMRQAFLNGFTGKEIMPAMYSYWDKYRADTNTLPAMTADPTSLAKYMPYEGRTPRQVADSSIYRKLYPFIANRVDAGTPILPEEREALNTYLTQDRLAQELGKNNLPETCRKDRRVINELGKYGKHYLARIGKAPVISLTTQDTPAFLPGHKGDNMGIRVHQQRFALRQLANADVITRYEYLYSNPELVKPFVDYYFNNPKDKEQFIQNFNNFKDKLDNNTAFVGPLSTNSWWKQDPRYADIEKVLGNNGQGVDTSIENKPPFYTEVTNWDKMVESGEDEAFLQKLSLPERIVFLKVVSDYWKNKKITKN